jgi:excisionase family DNA binding protein
MQRLPATLSIEEAARLLGFGRDTAYAAARSGALPTILIGKRKRRVPTSCVLQLLSGGQGERGRSPA